VRVQDAGSALAGVQINGGLSDTCRKPTERLWECSKKFTLSGGPELVPIAVRAVDIRGNAALDTFYVVLDSTLVATPQIVVLELADSARIPSRDITVRGEVSSLYGADTVYLTLDVDGASQGSTPALVFGDCDWSYPVSLTRPMGEGSLLSFTLERRAGAVRETTDVAEFVVIYDATVEDITRPTIVSIKSRGVDVADGYYASTSPLALSIEAYDQSGIAWVRIKGLLDSALTTLQSGFYVGDVGLLRGTSGNPVTVTAADNFSNSASETRVVYLNRIPRITRLPPYAVVPAGTVYRDSIGTADSDGDPLTVTVLIEVPGRPPVQVPADPTGVFTWTPSLADMGVARMRVQVSDGYPRIAEGEWTVLVTGGTAAGRPEFRTTAAEFPTALTAGRDSLRVGLRIVQSLDSSTYFFSARIVETDSFIQQPSSDTSLRWLPSLADTGARTLEVIVTNGAGLSDTIVPLPVVSVVAPYAPSQVSFASATWSVREDAGTYLIDVVLDRPSPTALSVGYRVLWGQSGTTVDTSDIRLLGNRVTLGVGATSAQIPVVIVDDTLVEGIEKFTMALDSARPADSILIGNPSSHLCYITNNDTVKFVDTVYFVPPTAVFGPEQARTVYAVIRANRPLSKQVQIAVNRSGTATENADYRIVPSGMPATILMPQGFDRDTFAALTIVDDAECEPSLEYVRLALKPRTPGVVLRKDSSADSVYLYHIYASDTPCVKRVGFIYGGNAPSALELRIGKLIDSAMGVPVEFRNEASVGSGLDPAPYAALFLSSSMANTAVGNMLRGVAIPILNASPANWVSMGLSGVSGEAWASSLRLHVALPWLPMSSVRILEGYAWVPFGQPQTAGYALIASVGTSAGGGVIGKTLAAIGPVTRDTLKTIYQYAGGASSDMPARRCTFPMCRTGDATAPAYTTSWWLLLRGCLYWTLYGFWPVQMDGGGI